jgi:hypothetical protein
MIIANISSLTPPQINTNVNYKYMCDLKCAVFLKNKSEIPTVV